MIRFIFGIIVVISGFGALISEPAAGISTFIIGFLIMLWGWKAMHAPKTCSYLYKFDVVGMSHKCQVGKISRQKSIKESLPGDTVTLQQFIYDNKRAYAVVNDRTGNDVGVVPADSIALMEKRNKGPLDGCKGYIVDIHRILFFDDGSSTTDLRGLTADERRGSHTYKQCTVEVRKNENTKS